MANIFNVADYFLCLQDEDAEDYVSNLKLQKLCYYGQGFYLALNNSRLFNNDILAWQHGPVIEDLYRKYKEFGSKKLPVSDGFFIESLTRDIRDLLEEIYQKYGQYSAWRLRDMTHSESPWLNAVHSNSNIISDKDMISFFKAQLA
jgi:uncharacterized phage-associated protein